MNAPMNPKVESMAIVWNKHLENAKGKKCEKAILWSQKIECVRNTSRLQGKSDLQDGI
jgi:hypothetical protein